MHPAAAPDQRGGPSSFICVHDLNVEEGRKRFRPLRPASGTRLAAAIVLGPVAWVLLFLVTSWVVDYTEAIALGLLIAAISFMAGVIALSLLRWERHREERRYADGR